MNMQKEMPEMILKHILPMGRGQEVVDAISKSNDVALVKTKPFSKSIEGWATGIATGSVIINALGPAIGLSVDGQLTGAIERITLWAGFPPGTGTASVLLVVGVASAVAFVRKKWFTHTITPEASNRAAAQGKVV